MSPQDDVTGLRDLDALEDEDDALGSCELDIECPDSLLKPLDSLGEGESFADFRLLLLVCGELLEAFSLDEILRSPRGDFRALVGVRGDFADGGGFGIERCPFSDFCVFEFALPIEC